MWGFVIEIRRQSSDNIQLCCCCHCFIFCDSLEVISMTHQETEAVGRVMEGMRNGWRLLILLLLELQK